MVGLHQQSWLAGVAAGLGTAVTVYGCVCYANGKGQHPLAGGVLGAALVAGVFLFGRSQGVLPTLGSALAMLGLLGLVLLRDRHKAPQGGRAT
jgi:hypothetical protein